LYALLSSTPIGTNEHKVLLLDLGKLNFTHHKYMIGVYSHLVLIIVGFSASFFFKAKPVDENLTYYGWSKMKKKKNK